MLYDALSNNPDLDDSANILLSMLKNTIQQEETPVEINDAKQTEAESEYLDKSFKELLPMPVKSERNQVSKKKISQLQGSVGNQRPVFFNKFIIQSYSTKIRNKGTINSIIIECVSEKQPKG